MKSKVSPVNRNRLADQVIDQLVGLINRGDYKVGDLLPPEPVLMKEFGVGRGTVREAIRALSLIGMVSVRPGHGTTVIASGDTFLKKPLQWGKYVRQETVEESVEARMAIEEAIAGVAAVRATSDDIAALEGILDQVEKAKKNKKKAAILDMQFHQTLAAASHNKVLIRVFSEFRMLIRIWIECKRDYAVSSDDVGLAVHAHEKIIQAVREKNADDARLAMREHLLSSSKNLRLTLVDRQLKSQASSS